MKNEKEFLDDIKKCPKCGEDIKSVAKKCKHCGTDLRNWFVKHKVTTAVIAIFILFIFMVNTGKDKELNELKEANKENAERNERTKNLIDERYPDNNSKNEESIMKEPELIELSGVGQQASQKFTLEKGLSIFKMNHSGTSHFSMTLMDSNGQYIELLTNEVGSFDGSNAVGIAKEGEYILDVSADGNWAVEIEQPRPSTAEKLKKLEGSGQQASSFISLDKGLTTFKMTHDGASHFSMTLMDSNGQYIELLVNEVGSFDGSKAVGISKSGIYLLNISADGNWSTEIE